MRRVRSLRHSIRSQNTVDIVLDQNTELIEWNKPTTTKFTFFYSDDQWSVI